MYIYSSIYSNYKITKLEAMTKTWKHILIKYWLASWGCICCLGMFKSKRFGWVFKFIKGIDGM